MGKRRGEVRVRRRAQVIDAAVAIIAEQGLQHLSLSAIEQRAGMSRGQLTYYFPAKEDILLAVFDRLLEMLHQRVQGGEGNGQPGCGGPGTGWQGLQAFLRFMLLTPPEVPEFHSLQYTFLSQIGHRDDFRRRLASLYGAWRNHLAADLAGELARAPSARRIGPGTVATFVQALLHGLAMQRVADPDAYDRQEMLDLVLGVLGGVLGQPAALAPLKKSPSTARPRKRSRRSPNNLAGEA
jgi:AcrR family transcriptional regulator